MSFRAVGALELESELEFELASDMHRLLANYAEWLKQPQRVILGSGSESCFASGILDGHFMTSLIMNWLVETAVGELS